MSMAESSGKTFTLTCHDGAKRVDSFLARNLKDLSRSRVQGLIGDGMVSVNGKIETKAAHALPGGACVVVTLPPPVPSHIEAEEVALDVRYEDAHLLVVNKPPGMVVHPARASAREPWPPLFCITAGESSPASAVWRGPVSFTGSTRTPPVF